jgi:hypothetical protein
LRKVNPLEVCALLTCSQTTKAVHAGCTLGRPLRACALAISLNTSLSSFRRPSSEKSRPRMAA